MLSVQQSNRFKRDIKKAKKQNKNLKELQQLVELLVHQKTLPIKYQDHRLISDYAGYRECHIKPDWLLIYKIERNNLELARLGSHSELFG